MTETLKILKENLNSEEFMRWENNIINGANINHKELILLKTDCDLSCIINSSFVWAQTPEGYDYWSEISDRKEIFKTKGLPRLMFK